MATFFEIFNKVLLELNYRTVSSFEDIYKNEHTKILDAINRVNEEVLSSYNWPFLLRKRVFKQKECDISTINSVKLNENKDEQVSESLNAPSDTAKDDKSSCVDGIVKSVFRLKKRLSYFPNVEKALTEGLPANCYTVLETVNDPKILTGGVNGALYVLEKTDLAPSGSVAEIGEYLMTLHTDGYTVFYYSKDYCIGTDGKFKLKMTAGGDASVLPMPWAEHVLLYGTCLKVKANPAYPKFGFWNTMYIQGLANLRKKSPSATEDEPFLSLSS